MTRVCCKCREEKELSTENFSRNNVDANAKGFQGKCKPCSREDHRAYMARRKAENGGEFIYKDRARGYHLKHKYGLKPEDIPDKCQVCNGATRKICVDHCHETGKIRGFLCGACNITLRLAEDDADRLRALADYLEK
jgi:hypothetical protein